MKKNIICKIELLLILTILIFPITVAVYNNEIIEDDRLNYLDLMNRIENKGCIISDWLEKAKLTASDAAFYDAFGFSVAIYGDYALIGSPWDDTSTGSVYVFQRSGNMWLEEDKLIASDAAPYTFFGLSISINGDYALIGAPGNDDLIGSAYIFKNNGTTWTEESKLTPSDGETYDAFGQSVSIYNDYALIGAPYEDIGNGSAYVFKRTGNSWIEEDKLTLNTSNSTNDVNFGHSVSIYGDYALIGAPLNEYTIGSAYIFKRDGNKWTEEDKLSPSDGVTYDWFGYSVSIYGDYALIGAHNGGFGSAYVFKRSGTTWTEEDKLLAGDGEEGDWFGYSVSLNSDYALLGAPFKDNAVGSAYVFKRLGTIWEEEEKLVPSDGLEWIYFGYSVSIYGDIVLVGSPDWYWGLGSAYIFGKEPSESDLDCEGDLSWSEVGPASTVFGNITVSNIGEPGSELNWTIVEWPEWGTWTFDPDSGSGLTPEDGMVTVDVELIAPEDKWEEFTGEIKLVNAENSDDYCIIDVSLATPLNQQVDIHPLFQRFLERFPNAFSLLRHLLEL